MASSTPSVCGSSQVLLTKGLVTTRREIYPGRKFQRLRLPNVAIGVGRHKSFFGLVTTDAVGNLASGPTNPIAEELAMLVAASLVTSPFNTCAVKRTYDE